LCKSTSDIFPDNSDTSEFTARRWSTFDEVYSLPKADKELFGNITSHKAFDDYLKDEATKSDDAYQRSALQSISQLHRPLWHFENLIKEYVEQDNVHVDTSSLWAMAFLNVKVR
jgi:hypothetical protein